MRYREVPPQEELGGLVACLWEFSANDSLTPGHLHTIPLDGCVSLAYVRSAYGGNRLVFLGPRLECLQVPMFPNDTFWGMRLLPGACNAAIGRPGETLFNKSGLLDLELPEIAAKLGELEAAQTLEDAGAIFQAALNLEAPSQEVMQSILAITRSRGNVKTSDLPGLVGLSDRQFLRVFRREVGLTPKQYSRICRLRSTALEIVGGKDFNWGQIAAERGFADQSHLVHEFQALFGVSPSEFESQFLPGIDHGALRRDL